MPPKRSAAAAYIPSTDASSATSTCSARPPTSAATCSAAAPSTSATTTWAPSSVNRTAASAPIPPPAPVITQTLRSSLPATSFLRRVEDVLDLAVPNEAVHAELAAEAAALEAAERRRHPYGGVRVDREHARLDRPRDAERAAAVLGPDRAREAVLGVVRDPDRLGLVGEGDQGRHRPEDLLARDPV